ncbi:parathyroid hormone/parathyroid hormone-related peptide receptor-like isoform X3 [Ostrea edulis]|uniref:parathyroid hormone/parathyroid hormone-related peptide receptor-like isoform X3 n=1 Tax=Ostrea edulis TaxID=37623 RepID=UPI002095C036|nr:parathyroid hormone/parathyroid hormone-related peptide receptor-like isoform X3 [Ostrea edulis]
MNYIMWDPKSTVKQITITHMISKRTDKMLARTDEKEYKVSFLEQERRITEAKENCNVTIQSFRPTADTLCPPVFDNIMCWNATSPGTTATQPCPNYVHRFLVDGFARRTCTSNGSWYINPNTNSSWTDFVECVPDDENIRKSLNQHIGRIQNMSVIGYIISLFSLVLAVVLLLRHRSKTRRSKITILHINLFIAYILRAVVFLIKDQVFQDGFALHKDIQRTGAFFKLKDGSGSVSHWECKLIVTLYVYTLVASTVWLCVDAHVLRKLLYVDWMYMQKRNSVLFHIAFGWVGPLLMVVPWVLYRVLAENYLCWNTTPNSWASWAIRIPVIVVILVNLFYFVMIVRVLYKRASETWARQTDTGKITVRVLKMTKHICILIPLFGVPDIAFTIMSLCLDNKYLYPEMLFNSFQGFMLSLTLCLTEKRVAQDVWKIFLDCIKTINNKSIGRKASQPSSTGDEFVENASEQKNAGKEMSETIQTDKSRVRMSSV